MNEMHTGSSAPWGRLSRWAWLPIPVLVTTMVGLWVAEPQVVWTLRPLNWLVHYGAVALGFAFIVIPAARSFLASGQPSVLMLGCGVLMSQIGAAIMPTPNANVGFAIYNSSILLSALCQFAGVAVTAWRRTRVRRSAAWLAGVYAGGAVTMGLVIACAYAGRLPVFFIEGQGGTLLRTLVVSAAVAFFALTAVLLWHTNRRADSPFFRWYALGLVLLAAGLTGSMVLAQRDSPLHWITRLTQVCGLVYMCVAVWASTRGGHGGGIPLEAVGDAWRAKTLLAGFREQTLLQWGLRYGLAMAAVAAAFGLRLALTAWIGPGLPTFITFYPAVMVAALLAGFGPGLVATGLTGLVVGYWVLPPVGEFTVLSPVERLGLAVFTGMGLFMSVVAELYRRNRRKAAAYDRETALRESQEALRRNAAMLVEAERIANIGSWAWDLQSGEVFWSDQMYRIFGEESDTFVPTYEGFMARVHPDDRQRVDAVVRDAIARGSGYAVEYRVVITAGARRVVLAQAEAFMDHGRPARVVGTALDITERKAAEERLASQASVLENVSDAVIAVDPEYRITSWNKAAERLYGWPAGDVLGANSRQLLRGEMSGDAVASLIEELAATGRVNRETVHHRRDGTPVVVESRLVSVTDDAGRITGYIAVNRDITARKRAEDELAAARQALERERDILQSVMDGAQNAHLVYLDRDFNFVRVNATYARTCGYRPEQMIGKNHFALYPDAENEAIFARVRDTGEAVVYHDKPFEFPDQPERGVTYWDWTLSPVRDAAGQIAGLVFALFETTDRKRAEEALRASEERLHLAQLNAGVGVWDWKPLSGDVTWTPELQALFGVAPGTIKTYADWRARVHPDDLARLEAERDTAIAERRPFDLEFRILHGSGQTRWLASKGMATYGPNGEVVRATGINIDITERKQTEEVLRFLGRCGVSGSGEGFFQELARYLAQALDMDFVCIDRLEDGHLSAQTLAVFHNGQFEDNVSYALKDTPCGDVVGRAICRFPRNVRALFPRDTVLQDLQAESYLGTTLWSAQGKPIGLIAVIGRKPLTETRLAESILQLVAVRAAGEMERLQTEEALRESEERFRNMFERHQAVKLVIEPESGAIVDANSAAARFYEYTREELRARRIQDLNQLPPEEVAAERERALAEQRNYFVFPHRLANGEVRWVEVYSTPVETRGRPLLYSIIHDITERRRAEESLRQAVAELARSNQDLEQFAYVTSHDLKEPLRMVTGFMSLLKERYAASLDAPAREYIGFAEEGAHRLQRLVDDLLAYSRVGRSAAMDPVDAGAAADRALGNLRASLEESGARIIRDPLPTVRANAVELTQVFQNLIGNALKFRRPGVTPEVRIGAERAEGKGVGGGCQVLAEGTGELTPMQEASANTSHLPPNTSSPAAANTSHLPRNTFLFSIRDNGIGIAPEFHERLFKVFERLHGREEYEGTGIGLAICRKIVERHGGRIWVESQAGQGSTFYFTLPAG